MASLLGPGFLDPASREIDGDALSVLNRDEDSKGYAQTTDTTQDRAIANTIVLFQILVRFQDYYNDVEKPEVFKDVATTWGLDLHKANILCSIMNFAMNARVQHFKAVADGNAADIAVETVLQGLVDDQILFFRDPKKKPHFSPNDGASLDIRREGAMAWMKALIQHQRRDLQTIPFPIPVSQGLTQSTAHNWLGKGVDSVFERFLPKESLNKLKHSLKDLQANYDGLEKKHNELLRQYATLQQDRDVAHKETTRVRTKLVKAEFDLTHVQGEANRLEVEGQLDKAQNDFKTKVRGLKTNRELQHENSKLQEENKAISEERNALLRETIALENDKSKLEKENEILRDGNDSLLNLITNERAGFKKTQDDMAERIESLWLRKDTQSAAIERLYKQLDHCSKEELDALADEEIQRSRRELAFYRKNYSDF